MGIFTGLKPKSNGTSRTKQPAVADPAGAKVHAALMPTPEPTPAPTQEPAIDPAAEPSAQPALSQRQLQRELTEGTPSEVAERHARHLLNRLILEWGAGEAVRYESIQFEYGEMCRELGIPARPWNQVGKHLGALTRKKGHPKKRYQAWLDHHGNKKHLRMYELPRQAV